MIALEKSVQNVQNVELVSCVSCLARLGVDNMFKFKLQHDMFFFSNVGFKAPWNLPRLESVDPLFEIEVSTI